MNQLPLVSVICLCHNHAPFVRESINSVWKQSYPNIELIVVDDGSSDGSKEAIKECFNGKDVSFIDLPTSIGNCAAFNKGFFKSSGKYIIDLAADDCLMPERVLKGVNSFIQSDAGVTFCDVLNVDKDCAPLNTHYKRNQKDELIEKVPYGDVYLELIKRYFISPPSMMIKRDVLEELNGYDESLSYEDFDFCIRSARNWNYAFTDEVLVKKRIVPGSLSDMQFRSKSIHQKTTLKVCQKIKELNRTKAEDLALRIRCLYEIKQCIVQRNFSLIPGFIKLI